MTKVKFEEIARECRTTYKGDKSGIPIVGLEHIIPKEILLKDFEVDTDNTFSKSFHKGQILFGRRRAYQQKAAVATFDGICSGDITVIEAIPGKIETNLLPFIIQNERFFEYAVQGSAGSLSPRVKWEHLASFEIDLPTPEEQRILANKLWSAYRLKESYKRLLTATQEMVKSRFIEMFGGLPINGTISDLVEKNLMSVKKFYKKEDQIEYIDISSIDNSSNTINETTSYKVKDAPSRAQQCVRLGDILVSTVRPINRNIAIVTKDLHNLVASTGFCVLRPKPGYTEYLLSVVKSDSYTEQMCDKASGGVYPAVNNGDVLSYSIHIPNNELLQEVATLYKQFDKSVFEIKKSIEAIDAVIKSLING